MLRFLYDSLARLGDFLLSLTSPESQFSKGSVKEMDLQKNHATPLAGVVQRPLRYSKILKTEVAQKPPSHWGKPSGDCFHLILNAWRQSISGQNFSKKIPNPPC